VTESGLQLADLLHFKGHWGRPLASLVLSSCSLGLISALNSLVLLVCSVKQIKSAFYSMHVSE